MKPWFNLNPHNERDKWWLYSSIRDTKSASINKGEQDIIGILAIQEPNDKYIISTWFEDDPNRYLIFNRDVLWDFNKPLVQMKEGDIVSRHNMEFVVYECRFDGPKKDFCKILERI